MNQTKQGKINLFHLLLMALIGAMLIAILFPVHLHCGAVAPITRTVSSAKQITLGLIMYASDYDDLPPFVHPFEFGIDPLDPYIKNSDDHDIPDPPHEGKRKPGTSDFRFQYVLQKQSCGGYVSTRLILGPFSKLTEPTMTIVMTGNVNDKEGKEIIVTSFADGYVKKLDRTRLKAVLPPQYGLGDTILTSDQLLFALPEYTETPKQWSVLNDEVAKYAKWAREQKK